MQTVFLPRLDLKCQTAKYEHVLKYYHLFCFESVVLVGLGSIRGIALLNRL